MEVIVGAAPFPSLIEVHRFDDQGVSLPASAGVSQVAPHRIRCVLGPIQGEDTHVAVGLSNQDDVIRRLDNLGLPCALTEG